MPVDESAVHNTHSHDLVDLAIGMLFKDEALWLVKMEQE